MTFHSMACGPDAAGIAPAVFAIDKHGKRDRRTYAVSADQVRRGSRPIRLEQSTLQQGPLRHPDLVKWSGDGSPFGYFMVVSPRVHALLSLAALPQHEVFDAVVQWPKDSHRKYGRGESPYVLYAFAQEQMLDSLDLSKTSLECTVRMLSSRMEHRTSLPAGTVKTSAEAWQRAHEACPADQRAWVTPSALLCPADADFEPVLDFASPHFPIATADVDLLFLDHSHDPWISDGLRMSLVAMEATGVEFAQSWDDKRLLAPSSDARGARDAAMLAFAQSHAGAPATEASFARHQARRFEVLSRRDRVTELRGGAAPRDIIEQLEAELDVLLPAVYRDCLMNETFPTRGRFRFLPIDELNTVDDIDAEWTAKSAPEAVRALLVAMDESGDYLGYLLQEDSMTQLDDQLMHFNHETAAVMPSRIVLKPKAADVE